VSHSTELVFRQQQSFFQSNKQYRGRFAPSPSGPLHLGSLIAALGSYLQAKRNNGLWFVRIEDIDETRCNFNAQNQILDALEAFGLNWDIDQQTVSELQQKDRGCLVQSQRKDRYQQVLNALSDADLVYPCDCTRKQIKAMGGLYDGRCRNANLSSENRPIRLRQEDVSTKFEDVLFGTQVAESHFAAEDFIIKRRDGLFAYQLVVVIDDIDQGITEVVRGADIMELTTRQIALYKCFGITPPSYLHLPLLASKPGFKLSKQNHAAAININHPIPELLKALTLLGLPTSDELNDGSVQEIIDWAVAHWQLNKLPKQTELLV